jgi:hypothetical protein
VGVGISVTHAEGRTKAEGVREQGAKENVWTIEGGSDRIQSGTS